MDHVLLHHHAMIGVKVNGIELTSGEFVTRFEPGVRRGTTKPPTVFNCPVVVAQAAPNTRLIPQRSICIHVRWSFIFTSKN